MTPSLRVAFGPDSAPEQEFLGRVFEILKTLRTVDIEVVDSQSDNVTVVSSPSAPIDSLATLASALAASNREKEADALHIVISRCLEKKELGGLALIRNTALPESDHADILFLVGACLESLNSQENARESIPPLAVKSPRTRPMTLAEKIFAHHAIGGTAIEGLTTGEVARIAVDWVIASEISWFGMKQTFDSIGETQIWRNDRFWIAGDHVVDPRINKVPRVEKLIKAAEQAKIDFKMTEYQGMNYTIMHTEFVRERAEPGMVIIGSDSHTCSSGAVGCLAVGLGASDVVMPLVTGETWFKIPESILISFVGKPGFGISGKDVILHILHELKRNTVAADRIVEFAGEGARWLSVDARFAISNMCTEFGAITGVFVPDEVTQAYISRRRRKANRSNSLYFKPDADANYAEKFEINLSNVQSTMALYPSPDHVVPVGEKSGMHLDGVFIGACTTTEEELVLAALVLQVGLKKKLALAKGKRHVVPGSLPIVEKLKSMDLLEIFETAGFTRGLPGCSYCVGMGADQAGEGETWLSSQNRNFRNRMGAGSFGNITSAAVVAASSFSMSVTDPASLLAEVDVDFFQNYTQRVDDKTASAVPYVEPHVGPVYTSTAPPSLTEMVSDLKLRKEGSSDAPAIITSKVITLGDFIDTDAIAPAEFLIDCRTDEDLGDHCLQHTHPDFRERVRGGLQVVVGGRAFGCGSSREQAVGCFKGLGVKAIIARSFSFIYGRNQPSLGLLGIVMTDDDFYATAVDDTEIKIDFSKRKILVGGKDFEFNMADMEYRLTTNKGLSESYKKFGRSIWEKMTEKTASTGESVAKKVPTARPAEDTGAVDARLKW